MESSLSSNTPALPQPQITLSKQRLAGRRLGSAPANKSESSQPELVGQRFGSVIIISPDLLWLGPRNRRFIHVLCECAGCGYRSVISLANLRNGRTKGCRDCNQPKRVPDWLQYRVTNMKRRCTSPKDAGWPRYGGRGIEFRFDSVITGALWIVENLGIPESPEAMHLDRINNEGHYEPGNLRWASFALNQSNTRKTKWSPMMHDFKIKFPHVRYADSSLRSLLASGMSFEEIEKRWNTPSRKPKGKYGTCSIADPAIASLAKVF